MKHKVRVTVLKKNLYSELQRLTAPIPMRGHAPAITKGMFSSFTATAAGMISGTWA